MTKHAGLRRNVETHPDVAWLVLACDLPNVDDTTVAFLLENRAETQPFTAFASSHDGLPEPLCALYRPAAQTIVRSFVEAGTICPRKILIRSDTRLLQQPNPAALDNVNTPDDLAPLFPMELILQEVSTEKHIEIPEEVREIYKLYRPTPLIRARRLGRRGHRELASCQRGRQQRQ